MDVDYINMSLEQFTAYLKATWKPGKNSVPQSKNIPEKALPETYSAANAGGNMATGNLKADELANRLAVAESLLVALAQELRTINSLLKNQ